MIRDELQKAVVALQQKKINMQHNSFTMQFEFLTNFAKEQLEKHGEFYPFASFIDFNDTLHPLAAYTGTEHPPSDEVVKELEASILSLIKDGTIMAAAICVNGTVRSHNNEKQDAIVIEIENSAGEAATVIVHYRRTSQGIQYDNPLIHQGQPKWFPQSSA